MENSKKEEREEETNAKCVSQCCAIACATSTTASFVKHRMRESAPTCNRGERRIKKLQFYPCETLSPYPCMCVWVEPLSFHHYHCRHRSVVPLCACEKHVLTNTSAMTHHDIEETVTTTSAREFNANDDCGRSVSSSVTAETPTRRPTRSFLRWSSTLRNSPLLFAIHELEFKDLFWEEI